MELQESNRRVVSFDLNNDWMHPHFYENITIDASHQDNAIETLIEYFFVTTIRKNLIKNQ